MIEIKPDKVMPGQVLCRGRCPSFTLDMELFGRYKCSVNQEGTYFGKYCKPWYVKEVERLNQRIKAIRGSKGSSGGSDV